jgi:hypothetical protein
MKGRPMVAADTALAGLPPEAWDRLAGRHFYSTSAWLGFCAAEYGGSAGAVVSYRDGDPACAVPVAESTDPPALPGYRWNDLLTRHGLPLLPPTGLLVGPREGYQTHFLGPAGGPSSTAVADVLDEVRQLHAAGGDPAGRACVAMYLSSADVLAARRAGVTAPPVLLEADAWIEVPAGGLPAWLDRLPSKGRRDNVRYEMRRFRDAGYTVAHMALAECYEQLVVPALATLTKHGQPSRPEEELRALHSHVASMGSAARVAVCSLGEGDPLGFCLYYVWGDTIFLRWIGFDYDRLVGAAEYFNLVYYGQIELAATLGVRWIHAGITAPEAKALRGAELRPLWMLDLAEDSPLARASGDVRQHNARSYERLAGDRRTAGALDRDAWEAFG